MFKNNNSSFDRDDTSRYLPWVIACMVFLSALSVAGIFILDNITKKLESGLNNTVTIQIPISNSRLDNKKNKVDAMSILKSLPGVKKVKHLGHQEVSQLLKPWLGQLENSRQLPIPIVIDITIDRSTDITTQHIKTKLENKIKGVMVDDHREWLEKLLNTIDSIKIISILAVTLIAFATGLTVVFTAKTSMGLQQETIKILHFIGAYDRYIATQFAIRSAWLGLKGGIGGLIVAVPLILGFRFVVGNIATGLLPELSLYSSAWFCIGLILPVVMTISMVTAYTTALKSLSKML